MTAHASQLRGVFAPVVTTFHPANGELDRDSFIANIKGHLGAGIHGIVVAGSTGEAALLDVAERAALIEAARPIVPHDKMLVAGTGAESTRSCLHLTRDAAARGVDAVLVVAPHYYGAAMTIDALRTHYRRVADESPVPVILYNIPKYMHFHLPPALVAELAVHENVIGLKDSSGQRDLLASYLAIQSPTFSVVNGNGPLFHHSLMSGSPGGILAVAVFAAELSLEVYNMALAGDTDAATVAQTSLSPLGAKIVGELGVPGVKAAMDRVGLHGGPVRSPLLPLTGDQRATVDELLRSAELAAAS